MKTIIDLHTSRQTFDYDCGVKALQTLMAYYGVYLREDKLIKELGTEAEGTRVGRMIAVAQAKGFEVKVHEHMTIQEVKDYVDRGRPVIVLLQAWADRLMTLKDWHKDYEDGHYAIVIGYDDKTLIFEDPGSFRRTWLTEHEFMVRWHDLDRVDGHRYEHFGLVLLGKEPVVHYPEHMN